MEKNSVTFEHEQEITVVIGDGPPIKAKWMIFGAGIAPQLKLEDDIEVDFGGRYETGVDTIHVRP
jgi:hypothetical protein